MIDERIVPRKPAALAPMLLLVFTACADGASDTQGLPTSGTTGASGSVAMAGTTATAGSAGHAGAAGMAMTIGGPLRRLRQCRRVRRRTNAAGSGSAGSNGGSGGSSAAGAGGAGGSAGGGGTGTIDPSAGPPDIPMPTGTCPEFNDGNVMFTVMGAQRRVVITMGDINTTGGPLIFYWHATGAAPSEAQRGLPVSDITAEGGIIVAPVDVSNAGVFPWLSQFAEHDALFDEVLACAVQKTKIDVRRIHALGWSAGGLMTTHLSFARSKYIASVATYSGGGPGMFQEMNNKFAAMIMAGGPGDQLVLDFYTGSMAWQGVLKQAGHFAMFCNHGGGHSIPTRYVPAVWQFFKDHPYGTNPRPTRARSPRPSPRSARSSALQATTRDHGRVVGPVGTSSQAARSRAAGIALERPFAIDAHRLAIARRRRAPSRACPRRRDGPCARTRPSS